MRTRAWVWRDKKFYRTMNCYLWRARCPACGWRHASFTQAMAFRSAWRHVYWSHK